MFLDGKKYACDACVRGHRVSGCNHSDRPLQEIAKKGRPVSQCQHCRTMRKSRSAHVKCDCGEKSKGPIKHHYINEHGKLVELPESMEKPEFSKICASCNCTSGGRCLCSIKKEGLESVPELSATPRASSALKKPMLQSTQSETCLMKFANGHHRPVPRHNSHHNNNAAPYHIPHEKQTLRTLPDHQPMMNRIIKSEQNSPGLKMLKEPNLLRSVSDYNLASRGGSNAGIKGPDLSIRTDFPYQNFYTTPECTPSLVPPNTAIWPNENFDFEIPGLTQSVSGDDSEIDLNFAAGLSPAHNLSPGFISGPMSPESSDVCESDYGISAQSSMINMSSMAPMNDLFTTQPLMDMTATTPFDSARQSPLTEDWGSAVNSARNSMQFQDDFLMMMPYVQQNQQPKFEFRS